MQVKIVLPWFLCVTLILVLCWLFYQRLDQAVTITYCYDQVESVTKQRNLLVKAFNSFSINESESKVRETLEQLAGDSFFQKGEGLLVAEDVQFFFEDGKLNRVSVGGDTE